MKLPGDLMGALNGPLTSAFQQALKGAGPGAPGDVGGMIQKFLGGAQAQTHGGAATANNTGEGDAPQGPAGGAAPPRRRRGGRRGGPGRGRRAKRGGGRNGRARRRGAVHGAKASRTQGPANSKAVPKGDFQGLTQKLQQMGISKQDVSNLSKKYGVPERMILGVMMQESGGNPNITSPAGAKGLMQLMPGTARELGVTNRSDPKQNLEGGVKYLGQMMQKFGGDESKALAAYNAGPGRVMKAGGVPHIRETQHYVRTITGNMGAAQAAFNAW
jgi:hypothetical protein